MSKQQIQQLIENGVSEDGMVETSREYVERVEAATILKILKKIIAHYCSL